MTEMYSQSELVSSQVYDLRQSALHRWTGGPLLCLPPPPRPNTVVVVTCGLYGISLPDAPVPVADDTAEFLSSVQTYLECLKDNRPASPSLSLAWEEFYRRYQPLVQRVAAKACRFARGADLDDLVQAIWEEILVKLPHLVPQITIVRPPRPDYLQIVHSLPIFHSKSPGAARWRPSPDGRCRSNEMVERTCG